VLRVASSDDHPSVAKHMECPGKQKGRLPHQEQPLAGIHRQP